YVGTNNSNLSLASTSISSFFITSSLPWQFSLIVGPSLSLVLIAPMWILFPGTEHQSKFVKRRGILDSLNLFSIKTFFIMTIGMSLGAFYLKSFFFWMPSFLLSAWSQTPSVYEGISFPT
ncbi:hypothetical protein PFISCL1PPCAC_2140, partial [Pristionchus fissidentatus]